MPPPKEERYTFADAMTWPDNLRIELIKGVPVMMAPPKRIHQRVSGALFNQFFNFLNGRKCEVYAAPFAVRPFEKDGDGPEEVDTLLEREYWIIDPDTRTAQVHLLEDGQYHSPVVYTEKANVPTSLWENFSVSLAQVFEGI